MLAENTTAAFPIPFYQPPIIATTTATTTTTAIADTTDHRDIDSDMTTNFLMSNGTRCSISPLTQADLNKPDEKQEFIIFDNLIKKKHNV